MLKKIIGIILLVPAICFGQSMGPLSGSQPKSFSTSPDNNGFLDNSVNLFSGQVQFSMPLMSLQGRGNVSYGLTMNYNSTGSKNSTATWNREAPTSVLGLGWSLSSTRIICDHKGTGTREDDEYFIVEGGTTNPLIYSFTSGSEWFYYTKNYQAWRISYNTSLERWTVIKEDGTKLIYGDNTSARNTVQYMVKWSNWIGSSSLAAGQQALAYIWDLSEISDLWGDKLTFLYLVTNEKVGGGAIDHTKASYLQQIQNLNGEKIVLSYLDKTYVGGGIREYVDVHQEFSEPDAYQEKYESKYLDKIGYYNESNELLSETRFGYSSIGTLETYKRLLSTLTTYNSLAIALPGYQFAYETSTAVSSNTGALIQVTSPMKGTVKYFYAQQNSGNTNRELVISSVSGYAEPQVFIAEDYVVITRRQLSGSSHDVNSRPVRVDVFTWENGKWNASLNIASLNSVTLTDIGNGVKRQDFSLVLGKDFFGILNKPGTIPYHDLKLFARNLDVPGAWVETDRQFSIAYNSSNLNSDVNEPVLLSGNNFILVGSKNGSASNPVKHFVYTKSGSGWNEAINTVNTSGEHYYSAANNYYITHKNAATDVIRFFYQDHTNSWQPYKTLNSTITPNTTNGNKSYWTSTNSFSLLMAYGASEYIYSWDENYNTSTPYITAALPGGYPDNSFVNFTNNSMATITNQPGCFAFRYNGSTWIPSGELDYYGPTVYYRNLMSFGEDFVFRPRSVSGVSKVTLNEFNPNSLSWPPAMLDLTVGSNNAFASLAGNNYVTYSGKFYFRSLGGSWLLDPTTVSYSWLQSGGANNDTFLQGGYDFVVTSDPYYPGSGNSALGINIKNGAIHNTVSFNSENLSQKAWDQRIWDRISATGSLVSSPQAALNTLVTYLTYGAGLQYMQDATILKLYRKAQDSFSGSFSTFVVTRMENNDGTPTTQYVNYTYEGTTATVDNSGTTSQFNKVTSVVDDDSSPSTKPVGSTETYFFNGTTQTFPTDGGGTAATTYNIFTGLNYETKALNSSGTQVSQQKTSWKKIIKGDGLMVRPVGVRALQDGREVLTTSTYDETNSGVLKTQSASVLSGGVAVSTLSSEYSYWSESFTDPAKNLISPVIYTRTNNNGTFVNAAITNWKNWGSSSIPLPSAKYNWNRTGSSGLTLTPESSSSWKMMNTVVAVDLSRGLVSETIDNSGIRSATLWHSSKPLTLATVTNAKINEVYFEGFEYATSNTSSDVKSGLKSSSAALTVNLPSAGTYKLTYWKKPSGGSWQLIEQSISAGTSIGGSGSLIDEVRLHPADARMTSYSYDKLGNVISVCNPNNQFSYYEYDYNGLNGLKIVKDQNGNIIEYNKNNIKN